MTLLDKVYDKYENKDFTAKMADLNPKREVSLTGERITDSMLYDKVRKRLENIKNSISPLLEPEETDPLYTMPFSQQENLPKTGLPENMVNGFNNAGGSGPGLLGILGPNGPSTFTPDPLQLEIELLIASLSDIPVRNASMFPNGWGSNILPGTGESNMFCLDCAQALIGNLGTELDALNDKNANYNPDLNEGSIFDEAGNLVSGTSEGDLDTNTATDGSSNTETETDTFYSEGSFSDEEIDNNARECALKELGVLRIVLIILRIIQTLKTVISYILDIVMMVMDCVQLGAGAWLNPTNIAKIAQRLAQKIMAVSVSMIGQMIQRLWDNLNLDCLVQDTKTLLDEISSVISGVSSLYAEGKNVISFAQDETSSVGNAITQKLNELGALTSGETWKAIGSGFVDGGKQARDVLAEVYTNPDYYKSTFSSVIPSDITQTVLEIQKSSANAVDQWNRLSQEVESDFGVDLGQTYALDNFTVF